MSLCVNQRDASSRDTSRAAISQSALMPANFMDVGPWEARDRSPARRQVHGPLLPRMFLKPLTDVPR
jgi:hypothetical protein